MKVRVHVDEDFGAVKVAVKKATITSLGHAAAYLRKIAVNSIRRTKKPSAPGEAPHSPTGVLKRGIAYSVEDGRQAAVIGPTRSALGGIAATHEFGGTEPPKQLRSRRFSLHIGGHGPVRNLSAERGSGQSKRFRSAGLVRPWKKGDKLLVVRLNTDLQVERAREVAETIPPSAGGAPSTKTRVYPARPFMGPALAKGRERLPTFWANSIKA